MGNEQSTVNSSLGEKEVCAIAPYVKKVENLSDDDLYQNILLSLEREYTLGNVNIPSVVQMKLALSTDVKGSAFRYNVYKTILSPVFEYKISPHFVQYYGGSPSCVMDNCLEILYSNKSIERSALVKFIYMKLHGSEYNIFDSTSGDVADLPLFEDETDPQDVLDQIYDNTEYYKFTVLLLERPIISMQEVLFTEGLNTETWIMLVQLASTTLVMSAFKTIHGPFDLAKVYIRPVPLQTIRYIWKDSIGKYHTVKTLTKFAVYISDWENCYVQNLGSNPLQTDIEYGPYTDLLHIYYSFLLEIGKPLDISVALFQTLFPTETKKYASQIADYFVKTDITNISQLMKPEIITAFLPLEDVFTKLILFVSYKLIGSDTKDYIGKLDDTTSIDSDKESVYNLSPEAIRYKLSNKNSNYRSDESVTITHLAKVLESRTYPNWLDDSILDLGSILGKNFNGSGVSGGCYIDNLPNGMCGIESCVESIVKTLPSLGASPSDVIILKVKPGTTYKGREIGTDLVLKLFLTSPLKKIGKTTLSREVEYESSIYEYLVGPMLYFNFNPHFVRYYGRGLDCSFKNILEIFLDKDGPTSQLSKDLLKERLIRNSFYMGLNYPGRPGISQKNCSVKSKRTDKCLTQDAQYAESLDTYKRNTSALTYGMIVTEQAKGSTFGDWIYANFKPSNVAVSLFQQLSVIVAMIPFKAVHQDMHQGNFFVEKGPYRGRIYIWEIPVQKDDSGEVELRQVCIRIYSNFILKIYDWDRGYMESLGDNPVLAKNVLEDNLCGIGASCSVHIPNRDMTKIVTHFIHELNMNASILDQLFPPEEFEAKTRFIEKVLSNGAEKKDEDFTPVHLKDKETELTLENEFFDSLYGTEQIFANICVYLKSALELVGDNQTPDGKEIISNITERPVLLEETDEVYDMRYSHIVSTLSRECPDFPLQCTLQTDCLPDKICLPYAYTSTSGRCCAPNFPTSTTRDKAGRSQEL